MLILNRHDDFTEYPGQIAINPHAIAAVQPIDGDTSRVHLATGKEFDLAHSFVETLQMIADALTFDDDSEDFEPDP